jgi:glutathione S-transferase
MKIYDYEGFPNPRRVRIFLAEKGIKNVPYEQIDVPAGDHRKPDFLAKNPYAGVPVLELDDGTHVCETVAISRYFEEIHPGPSLLGDSAKEKAEIDMWQRRVESSILDPALAYFHHATDGLGQLETYQNADWGTHNRDRVAGALEKLDHQLDGREFVAGDAFSIADITAIVGVDLAKALGIDIPESLANVQRWYDTVSARPSMAA